MKVTYLIGNGLDIHVGLKTRYIDFYNYLNDCEKINLNNKIFTTIINENFGMDNTEEMNEIDWSDFEIAIGKYVARINDRNELENFYVEYEEFVDEFTDFIDRQLNNLDPKDFLLTSKEVFHHSIKEPIKLEEREQALLKEKYSKYENYSKVRNFIVFNYTKIFEEIYNSWKIKYENTGILAYKPIHIHGYTQEQTLMGVNDASQLTGNFSKDEDLQMMLIKTQSNQEAISLRFNQANKVIDESNLIIVFGMSLGDSDKHWWQKNIENLEKNPSSNVIIYAYEINKKSLYKHNHKMLKKKKEWKNRLLKQVDREVKENLSNQIFIQFDTQKIFNFSNITNCESTNYLEDKITQ